MRLNDEKRSAVKEGDIIEFKDCASGRTVKCSVTGIGHYNNFFELYADFDKISIGYAENQTAKPEDMYEYYTPQQIEKYGVLAIGIKLL